MKKVLNDKKIDVLQNIGCQRYGYDTVGIDSLNNKTAVIKR